MNLLVVDTMESIADHAAELLADRVADHPALTLTTPTGSTPIALYRRLVRDHEQGRFSLDAATVFMLDEYLDLPTYPRGSFLEFLQRNLGDVIFNGSTNVQSITPSDDPSVTTLYDKALDAAGGLDLAIVGVGRNGHVGFNEPGALLDERTHIVTLTASTLEANFAGVDESLRPSKALTIGLRDLHSARAVLMLVAGAHKHRIAQLLAAGSFDHTVPATYLLDHPDLTVLVEAALLR